MSGTVLDGRRINQEILAELKPRIELLRQAARPPALAVVLVGEDPASHIYVRNKIKTCHELGITSIDKTSAATITTEDLLQLVHDFNNDPQIDGILVQSPLPRHVDSQAVLLAMNPAKDAD
ncbi:MAG: tetrahydrofolate dehydrogenase/cyclohydrolase catalytic domain-containing protein, partial [Bryobacteraceae bacterium]